jgi:DNA polymerase (family 10)
MGQPSNDAIASELRRMANDLDRLQANPFRIRAYRRAAEAIAVLPEEAAVVARRGELIRIKGIGADLAQRITAYCEYGRMDREMPSDVALPGDIRTWASLPGLSPSILRYLHDRLQIRTLDDLEALVRSRFLRTLPGITAADEDILEGIARLRTYSEHDGTVQPPDV